MASRKHVRDEEYDDDQPPIGALVPNAKKTKTDHGSTAGDIVGPAAPDEFTLTIKLASTSKAKQNDPELTLAQREIYQQHLAKLSQEDPAFDMNHLLAYREAAKHTSGPSLASVKHITGTNTSKNELDSSHIVNSRENEPFVTERNLERRKPSPSPTSHTIAEAEADQSSHEDESETEEDHYYDEDYNEDDEDDLDEVDEDRSGYDSDFEFKWLEPIRIEIASSSALDDHGSPLTVGHCKARLIRREQMRNEFHEEMERPSEETARLAFDLFDRYGRLRSEFLIHPIIKGSGIWGQELDRGDILLIQELFVMEPYRRRGLGKQMMDAILTLAEQKTWAFFAFLRPSMLKLGNIQSKLCALQDRKAKQDMEKREINRAVSFCRSLGFRRVGSSKWFATTLDREHASRTLASAEDFDPPEPPQSALHPLLQRFQQINDPTSTNSSFITTQPPGVCSEPDFLSVLHSCNNERGVDDPCWTSKDEYGNTVLHLAALKFESACVEWIVSKPFGAQLLQSRNYRGETPAESLEFKLEELRTLRSVTGVTKAISDQFRGHDEHAIRCLIMLKQLDPPDSAGLQRMIGGCTCGRCLEGFLSPRMVAALQSEALCLYDIFDERISLMDGPEWVDFRSDGLAYLPTYVRNSMKTNKSIRQGYTNLFQYIANCLEEGSVPCVRNILSVWENVNEWPPATHNYLQRGGTVEPVFLAVCQLVMDEDEWTGNGQYFGLSSEEIEHLPECRNDREFGYMSGSCGYRRIGARTLTDWLRNVLDEHGNRIDSPP